MTLCWTLPGFCVSSQFESKHMVYVYFSIFTICLRFSFVSMAYFNQKAIWFLRCICLWRILHFHLAGDDPLNNAPKMNRWHRSRAHFLYRGTFSEKLEGWTKKKWLWESRIFPTYLWNRPQTPNQTVYVLEFLPNQQSMFWNSFHLWVWGCLGYTPWVCWGSLRV